MKSLFYPILYATTISAVFPVAAGIFNFRQTRFDTRLILALLTLVLMIDCYGLFFASRQMGANWIHHFYSPLEYAVFAAVISTWQAEKMARKFILLSIVFFSLLSIWDIFVSADLKHTNDFTASVACAFFVGMTSYTLIGIDRQQAGRLFSDYRFWIMVGLLIYSAGNLAYFAFFRNFISYYLWAGHNLLNILANICYAIGFLCLGR
jgi:hypothetical protein